MRKDLIVFLIAILSFIVLILESSAAETKPYYFHCGDDDFLHYGVILIQDPYYTEFYDMNHYSLGHINRFCAPVDENLNMIQEDVTI